MIEVDFGGARDRRAIVGCLLNELIGIARAVAPTSQLVSSTQPGYPRNIGASRYHLVICNAMLGYTLWTGAPPTCVAPVRTE